MVQNEVVNTLIKKQPLWVVFFFKEIKMLMVTFFPFFFFPQQFSVSLEYISISALIC